MKGRNGGIIRNLDEATLLRRTPAGCFAASQLQLKRLFLLSLILSRRAVHGAGTVEASAVGDEARSGAAHDTWRTQRQREEE